MASDHVTYLVHLAPTFSTGLQATRNQFFDAFAEMDGKVLVSGGGEQVKVSCPPETAARIAVLPCVAYTDPPA